MDRAWLVRFGAVAALVVGVGLFMGRGSRPAAPPPSPRGGDRPGVAAPVAAPAPSAGGPATTLRARSSRSEGVSVEWMCATDRGRATPGPDGAFALTTTGAGCSVRLLRRFGADDLAGPWEPFQEGATFTAPAPEGLGLAVGPDLRVAAVEPGMPADVAGVRAGDVLMTADGQPAAEVPPEWFELVDGGVALTVRRDGREVVVQVP